MNEKRKGVTRITAIIQARMGSTRLPGKVLMEVRGKALLAYQIERIRASRRIQEIIIATTTNPVDDAIVAWCNRYSVPSFRGSEADVLDRFYRSAVQCGADVIVRVTGDCPLLDPAICDKAIDTFFREKADIVNTGETIAEGLDCEVISFKALEEAHRKATLKSEREHVTVYFRNHPESYRKITIQSPTDDSRYRFTVDEERDLAVVRAVIENLYSESNVMPTTDEIKRFLDRHPEIYCVNKDIVRNEGLKKSLQNDGLAAKA